MASVNGGSGRARHVRWRRPSNDGHSSWLTPPPDELRFARLLGLLEEEVM